MAKNRLSLAALAAAIAFIPGPAGATAQIAAAELAERIDRAHEIALAAEPAAPARMDELRRLLGFPVVVVFAGGEVSLPADPVLESLTGTIAADFRLAATRLGVLARAVALAEDAAPFDEPRLIRTLEGAYADIRENPSWLEHARRFLGRALTEILGYLGGLRDTGSVIAWILIALLAIGVLLLLRRLSIVPERRRARRLDATKTPVDWTSIAEEAMARDDVVGAIRARFRLLIVALSDRGVVVDEPSLTAGECRQAVRSAMPGAYLAVSRATEVFELAAYAHVSLTTTDVDALREAERVVRAA